MSVNTSEQLQCCFTDASSIEETVTQLVEVVTEQQQRLDDQADRIDQLETELAETRQQAAKDRQRINDLEEHGSNDADPTPEAEKTTVQEPSVDPQTGLEEVIQLPEHVANDTLTVNQQRARFIAKDIADYSRSVPAGRAIKSSEIRKVLTAAEGGTVHTQTVSRVMQFLEQLGGDSVKTRQSRSGQRLVVFDENLVKRIVAYSNTVVTDNGATVPQTV